MKDTAIAPAWTQCMSCLLLFLALGVSSNAQLSKGHRILIERGLQIQGLCIDDNFLTLSTYSNAHYTSVNWINEVGTNGLPAHSSRPDWIGPAPGFPWARWVKAENQVPPHITPYGGDEAPYMNQLVALQLGDEWDLNTESVRNRLVNWFVAARTNWPNTILYHNSWGSQVPDGLLMDFYTRASPDMLCFDTYPWKSVWDAGQPNHTGPPIPGPPTGWYGDLRRYREHARAAGIPLGIYRQTFHAVQDYDNTVYRDPSHSELRLNTFAALAFNAKFFTDFTYNTGANSMFERACNWCGDSQTNSSGLYAEITDVNRRARNLGKALVRLTPITTERIAGYTTTMMFIRGQDAGGALTPVPIGFIITGPETHTSWVPQHNDPYLAGWSVMNTGIRNNGHPGDVIVSWFKVLDESFDGPNHNGEVYMMVVNGLTHPSGTVEECSQEITLDFHSALGAIDMLNPATGLAETKLLPLVNGVRRLVLNLNGGDGVLFKFASGAPFAGAQSIPVIGVPVITIHPANRENIVGTETVFNVTAAGSAPLGYQWQFKGANIPGATNASYTRSNVQFSDSGTYSVVVSNSFGSAPSMPAELSVLSGVPFLYEPFDYPAGTQVSSNTPANWGYGGTGTNDLRVNEGSLSYPGLALPLGNSITNGGVGLGVRRLFGTNVASGKLFFSALFRMNDPGFGVWNGLATQIGAFTAPDNTFRLAVMVRSNSPSGYVFGVQKGGTGAAPSFDAREHSKDEVVFLAGCYDFEVLPNTVSLWINPSASAFGAVSPPGTGFIGSNVGPDGLSIDRFNFRQNTPASVPAAMQWDELRIGFSWRDVTPLEKPDATILTNVSRSPNGVVQFRFSGRSALAANVYYSTNLAHWSFIGTPTEIAPGEYQFTDHSAASSPQRFYKLRWP